MPLKRVMFSELLSRWKHSGKQLGAVAVGEETEVADANEASRQQVEQEPAQELVDIKRHEPFLVAVSGVSPAEGDVAIGEATSLLLEMATRWV